MLSEEKMEDDYLMSNIESKVILDEVFDIINCEPSVVEEISYSILRVNYNIDGDNIDPGLLNQIGPSIESAPVSDIPSVSYKYIGLILLLETFIVQML
jgi:hypothetical protein